MKNLLTLISFSLIFTACKPEQLPTEYNSVRTMEDIGIYSCDEIIEETLCSNIVNCQPVYNFNEGSEQLGSFQACVYRDLDYSEDEVTESPSSETEQSSPESSESESSSSSGTDNSESESSSTTDTESNDEGSQSTTVPGYEVPINNEVVVDSTNLCGKNGKKVVVCHYPPGNAEARHNICISENGWKNGHDGHHNEDHLGVCK